MAQYIYRCVDCREEQEVQHSMKDDPAVSCPSCNGSCTRVPQASGVVLRGRGFYRNDKSFGQADATGQTWGEG